MLIPVSCLITGYLLFRTVTGSPENDPKGRWRQGGGINVPVKVQLKLQERQARDLKRKIEICGLVAKLESSETKTAQTAD